ncbi:MAG: RdgB/HAM1 family non-canonical purine NTP pyrophosphatase [Flavobacteriales bacterium]|nr:RdgB/HAM1 family non-canonical purine NTP pyrophosphatase [Flavobacteriales bacterium]
MQIVFATNNLNKLKEIQQILPSSIRVLSLKDIGFEGEIPEDYETLEENAFQKAQYIFDRFQIPCFADDTGLEVEVLNGAPGVYSARYAGEECLAENNIQKLLLALQGKLNRNAAFRTVVAFVTETEKYSFEGKVGGQILLQKQGEKGFGYDPIFQPEGYKLSFAEMLSSDKNDISHRGKAVRKFANYISSL